MLLAAFGCALERTHCLYDGFEDEVRRRFPDLEVRRAFTSNRIRAKLRERGLPGDSVGEALSKMIDDGFRHVAVQSLHTVPGVEYEWTVRQAEAVRHPRKGLTDVCVGAPLLHTAADLERAAETLAGYIPPERGEKDGVLLVGHGTYHQGQAFYLAFEGVVSRLLPNTAVGALLGGPGPVALGERFLERGVGRVFLVPFMCVPGHHVHVDVFGEGPHSWLSVLGGIGLEVVSAPKGTLGHAGFRRIWLDHLADAVGDMEGKGPHAQAAHA